MNICVYSLNGLEILFPPYSLEKNNQGTYIVINKHYYNNIMTIIF